MDPITWNGMDNVRVIRSPRRKKTIAARRVQGVLEVVAPARMSDRQLMPYVKGFLRRLDRREQARSPSKALDLQQRAERLNRLYFEGGLAWTSIEWSAHQKRRYGSCTSSLGTIRISTEVANLPAFVQDYILVHEMAHLVEPNHGRSFRDLVNRYPLAERARGYLMALAEREPPCADHP